MAYKNFKVIYRNYTFHIFKRTDLSLGLIFIWHVGSGNILQVLIYASYNERLMEVRYKKFKTRNSVAFITISGKPGIKVEERYYTQTKTHNFTHKHTRNIGKFKRV